MCSIGVSLPGLFAPVLLTAYLATAGCDDLPTIARGVCGNRVIDPGEDCDDFPSDACHAPDTAHACQLNCRVAACPEGAACGVDGVCRTASGQMSPFPVGFDAGVSLVSGDFDGDERTDLLLFGSETALLSFDDQRRTSLVSLAVAPSWAAVSRINGDQRDDVIIYSVEELNVLEGAPTGLTPVPQIRATPESASQRILSVDFEGDGRLESLLIADENLLAFPRSGEDLFNVGALAVSAGEIAGPVPSLPSTNIDPCPAIVIAGEGADAVQVYDICDGQTFPPSYTLTLSRTVALPAPYLVGPAGVRVGDVDGDGFDDLIIATRPLPEADLEIPSTLLHVAYGLGKRSFQSRRRASAGVISDNAASSEPLIVPGARLLDVADLDGDAYLDFITDVGFTVSPLGPAGCDDDGCIHYQFENWVAAAAADFNRDRNVDLVAFPSGATSMRFFLGTGNGGFNPSTISVGAPSAEVGRMSVAVGDYDGDLTTDLAFTLQQGTGSGSPRKAAILYGRAFGVPSEIQSTGLVGDFAELVTVNASLSRASANDLLFRASTEDGVGVGTLVVGSVTSGPRMAGAGTGDSRIQPAHVLSSPLIFPNTDSVEDRRASLVALAFGAFTGDSSRQEAAALTIDQGNDPEDNLFWLPLVENRQYGLAIRDARESPIQAPAGLTESLRQNWTNLPLYPGMQALDLDADGSDELIIPDWHVTGGALVFWVGHRVGDGWSFSESRVALPPGTEAEILANQGGGDQPNGLGPVDVDRDGRPDLVFQGWRPSGSVVYVVRNVGLEPLSEAKAFVIDSSVNATAISLYDYTLSPTAFINVDGDAALELVAGSEDSLRFYDLDWGASTLDELTALRIDSGEVRNLTVADFDGDGISDVAASGETSMVYLGEPVTH